jgi:hypothetical protein
VLLPFQMLLLPLLQVAIMAAAVQVVLSLSPLTPAWQQQRHQALQQQQLA